MLPRKHARSSLVSQGMDPVSRSLLAAYSLGYYHAWHGHAKMRTTTLADCTRRHRSLHRVDLRAELVSVKSGRFGARPQLAKVVSLDCKRAGEPIRTVHRPVTRFATSAYLPLTYGSPC